MSLWSAFLRISGRRGSNGFGGVNPIPHSEIEAFLRLSKSTLTAWEVETIEMLDDIYRTEQAKQITKK